MEQVDTIFSDLSDEGLFMSRVICGDDELLAVDALLYNTLSARRWS